MQVGFMIDKPSLKSVGNDFLWLKVSTINGNRKLFTCDRDTEKSRKFYREVIPNFGLGVGTIENLGSLG